jgi:integrase
LIAQCSRLQTESAHKPWRRNDAGARSAVNPHAACDAAGTGDEITATPTRARKGKPRTQPRSCLRVVAPVPDPTAKVKKSSWAADEWQLTKDVLPAWRHVPVTQITRAHVVALLDTIADPAGRNAPSSAVHVRRLLSKMFNFALARNYGLAYNPVQGTEPPAPNGRRTRVLNGREIGALMHALDEERECGYWLTAAWHRLILLTAQRPGEVLAMEWEKLELGARDGWWTVRMSKNGDPIRAALSPQVVRTLRELAAGRGVVMMRLNAAWPDDVRGARFRNSCFPLAIADAAALRRTRTATSIWSMAIAKWRARNTMRASGFAHESASPISRRMICGEPPARRWRSSPCLVLSSNASSTTRIAR